MIEKSFEKSVRTDISSIKQKIIDAIIVSPSGIDLNSIISTLGHNEPWKTFFSSGIPIKRKGASIQIDFSGHIGLQFAKYLATSFYNKYVRSPRTKDLPQIHTAIYSKLWREFGIKTWNDFLSYSDLPLNRGEKWSGQKGLEHAINLFHDNYDRIGKVPTVTDLKNVFARINDGTWAEQGIFSWSDFVTVAMTQRWNMQETFML